MYYIQPVAHLINELEKLPSIGPKTAQRLAFYLVKSGEDYAKSLAQAILEIKEKIITCSICQNISDINPCSICQGDKRQKDVICVVAEAKDVLAVENTREFKGLYHVLHGVISPTDGVGPEDLKIKELLNRLQNQNIKEIIVATNPTVEGDATAMYLSRLIKPLEVKVTRLAYGLPLGADLDYADEVTLARALEGRRQL